MHASACGGVGLIPMPNLALVRRMRVRFGAVLSWLRLTEIVPSDMVPGYVMLMRPIGHMRPTDGASWAMSIMVRETTRLCEVTMLGFISEPQDARRAFCRRRAGHRLRLLLRQHLACQVRLLPAENKSMAINRSRCCS